MNDYKPSRARLALELAIIWGTVGGAVAFGYSSGLFTKLMGGLK